MSVMDTIKEHPYITVGGVIGIVVLFLLLRGGGSSTGSAVTTTSPPQDNTLALASMQAGASVQSAEIGASVQNRAIDAALVASQTNAATQTNLAAIAAKGATDIAALQAGVMHDSIAANETVALNNNETQLEMLRTSTAGQVEQQRIATQGTIDALSVQSNALIAAQAIQSNERAHIADLTSAQNIASITANAAVATKQIEAHSADVRYAADTQVVLNREWAPIAIQLQQIAATASTSNINAQTQAQVAIAQANNDHGSVLGGLFTW